jgi:hypothetical protein
VGIIEESFIALCDDDFFVSSETSFAEASRLFEAYPDIGVIGGKLFDADANGSHVRNWELNLFYDSSARMLTAIPIYNYAPRVRQLGTTRAYLSDTVLNFAIFRKSIFSQDIRWDARFTCNGEHEDFFLTVKTKSSHAVAYLPTLIAYHQHPLEYAAYRSNFRDRSEGWLRFLEKWNLEQYLELGLGVRTTADSARLVGSDLAAERFSRSPNLSVSRSYAAHGSLALGRSGELDCLESGGAGLPATEERGGATPLLLKQRGGTRLLAAEAVLDQSPAVGPRVQEAPHQLESLRRDEASAPFNGEVLFRYDAAFQPKLDFVLWYRGRGGDRRPGMTLDVFARFFGEDGSALRWESLPMRLERLDDPFWKPLLLEIPLIPGGHRWIRFSVHGKRAGRDCVLCSGFIRPAAESDAGRPGHASEAAVQTFALCEIPGMEIFDRAAGESFEGVLNATGPGDAISLLSRRAGAGDGLIEVRLCERIAALCFVLWKGFGRTLVVARVPPLEGEIPCVFTIPDSTPNAASRLIAFTRDGEFADVR